MYLVGDAAGSEVSSLPVAVAQLDANSPPNPADERKYNDTEGCVWQDAVSYTHLTLPTKA